jgi:hypothetical protein
VAIIKLDRIWQKCPNFIHSNYIKRKIAVINVNVILFKIQYTVYSLLLYTINSGWPLNWSFNNFFRLCSLCAVLEEGLGENKHDVGCNPATILPHSICPLEAAKNNTTEQPDFGEKPLGFFVIF